MKVSFPFRLAGVFVLLAGACTVQASSVTSSASSTASASIGSISASLDGAGDVFATNAQDTKDYVVMDVTPSPDRVEGVRLRLREVGAGGVLQLDLPVVVSDRARLEVGDRVRAKPRVYGFEFANADTGEAFFLALSDEWLRELVTHPLGRT